MIFCALVSSGLTGPHLDATRAHGQALPAVRMSTVSEPCVADHAETTRQVHPSGHTQCYMQQKMSQTQTRMFTTPDWFESTVRVKVP